MFILQVHIHYESLKRSSATLIDHETGATSGGAQAVTICSRSRENHVFCFGVAQIIAKQFLKQLGSLPVRTRRQPEFVGSSVGLDVGFWALPDMNQPSWINDLDAKCRVCRVFIGGESSQEIETARFLGGSHFAHRESGVHSGLQLDSGGSVIGWEGEANCLKTFGGPGRVRTVDLFHAI